MRTEGATGVTLFPSQDGAVKECWRPRFRLAPVLAVPEGVVPAEARPGWGKQGGKDGQGAWRVLLVRAIRSLVSVTQVLSKEELGLQQV